MSVIESPASAPLLTYETYLTGDLIEGKYDIIDGEVVFDVSGAALPHQDIAGNFYLVLRAFQKRTKSGRTYIAPCDVLITRFPFRTRQPDVFFISTERLQSAGGRPEEGPLEAAPEIVVEVLSPSETPRSIRAKLEDYRMIGVREAWLASRDGETVQVLRLDGDEIETAAIYVYGDILVSLSIPGLEVPLSDIFVD